MESMIWDIFIKNDIARVKEMICGERAQAVATTAGRVTHKKAFTGFAAKLSLKFGRDVGKTMYAPDFQMGNIWLGVFQNFKGGYVLRQCGRNSEVEKKACS